MIEIQEKINAILRNEDSVTDAFIKIDHHSDHGFWLYIDGEITVKDFLKVANVLRSLRRKS